MAEGVVVVTGGNRGLGAEIAVGSAEAGNDVVIGYRDPAKEKRATAIAEQIRGLERRCLAVRADITNPTDVIDIMPQAQEFAGQQDQEVTTLVLNAAGGLEAERGANYADEINAEAPWSLAADFLLSERRRGAALPKSIVYVTSLPSHFYGHKHNEMPAKGYEAVAASKHRGETMLREDFGRNDEAFGLEHRLLVAVADIVKGTAGALLLNKAYKDRKKAEGKEGDLLKERDEQLNRLIGRGITNTVEFGRAIVGLFMNDELPTGHTLYVPRPVLYEYVVPEDELPFGAGDPSMHTFVH